MKRFQHHTFLLVLALTVTLLVTAVYGYMYYVVNISITRAAAARDIVALEMANKDREQDVRKLYERTADNRATLANFFIPADRVVDFIEAIESLGLQTGSDVSLSSIKAASPGEVPGSPYGLAHADVEATGSWSSIMRTLSLAENLPYAVVVKNTRVGISSSNEKNPQWKVSFTLEATLATASSTEQSL